MTLCTLNENLNVEGVNDKGLCQNGQDPSNLSFSTLGPTDECKYNDIQYK